jgi:hypothetical protein
MAQFLVALANEKKVTTCYGTLTPKTAARFPSLEAGLWFFVFSQ